MSFFVVQFKIYTSGQDARRRLFRDNIPERPYSERWIHCLANCANPDSIARARPDRIDVGGLVIPTRGGRWVFSEFGVWIFLATPETEHTMSKLDLSQWNDGKYRPSLTEPYRC